MRLKTRKTFIVKQCLCENNSLVFCASQPNPKANYSFDTNPSSQTKLNCRWRSKKRNLSSSLLMAKDFPNFFWLLYKFSNRIQTREPLEQITTIRRILCNSNFTSQPSTEGVPPKNPRPSKPKNLSFKEHCMPAT